MRDNLRKKGVCDDIAEEVIEYLKSIDYIDDRRARGGWLAAIEGGASVPDARWFTFFFKTALREIAESEANSLPDDRETALASCAMRLLRAEKVEDIELMKLLTRRGYHAGLARDVIREFKKLSYNGVLLYLITLSHENIVSRGIIFQKEGDGDTPTLKTL